MGRIPCSDTQACGGKNLPLVEIELNYRIDCKSCSSGMPKYSSGFFLLIVSPGTTWASFVLLLQYVTSV